jgi:hypothetical protein
VPQVLVLTHQDGTTEIAKIGAPYLAVLFERTFHRAPETAEDAAWLAFVDRHDDRPPEDQVELDTWLKPFIATEVGEWTPPDPTGATANGSTTESDSFSPD